MGDERGYAVPAQRFRLRAEVDEPGSLCYVALDATGETVGLCSGGLTRDERAPTGWELYSVNLLERARGTGLADELLRAVVGDRDASLWVLPGNARARAFYRRHGFLEDGSARTHEDSGAEEIRMVRRRRGVGGGR